MQGSHSHCSTAPCRDLLDLGRATVVSPLNPSTPEDKAVTMLIEEVAKRTGIRWARQTQLPAESP